MSMGSKGVGLEGLGHRAILTVLAVVTCTYTLYLAWQGAGYYTLPLTDRPFHPMHAILRPSGTVGIRLGFFAALAFVCLYLYPIRKRVKALQKIGKTRNWLNFHVLFGLTVPVIVTFHSSLKLNGLAGMAYWIMMAIVASGIVGRYLYSQIPRSVNAAELSLKELQDQAESLALALGSQALFTEEDLAKLIEMPGSDVVESMSLPLAVLTMAGLDLQRPFRVATLRRRVLGARDRWITLGGLRRSGHEELERIVDTARAQSWLNAKVLFLNRAAEVFHLWHVIHRPFSYSFAVLVTAHIALVMLMGYF